MVNVAILGYGTVGSGVYEVITTNNKLINKKAGEDVSIKYVLDLRDFPGDPVEKVLVHDFNVILEDPSVKVVVEVMGGVEPAYTFAKKSLLAGKSVCTSNKELVANKGPELIRIAKENKVNFLFEASCGGGIPIIRPLNSSLTADDIIEISGILNGTTNYILTKMTDEGWDFDTALKKAQELGYAERNPEADVLGYDACRKIAILSSLAYGKTVGYEDIHTEGITSVTYEDIEYAKKMGYAIKLIASSEKKDGKIYAMVAPMLVRRDHPLCSINGVFNAIFVRGNMLGDAMFYGSGAGKLPTASAVAGDVVDAVRHVGKNIMVFWDEEKEDLQDIGDFKHQFFVRVKGDKDTVKEKAEKLFSVTGYTDAGIDNETGFVTEIMKEDDFEKAYAQLEGAVAKLRIKD
ncbi:MAG: homoserine dehydrogenase [Lachnospiraceae bacterium]|nr:homoserine dehydrogenase [Lachnospiraceae bacterium]